MDTFRAYHADILDSAVVAVRNAREFRSVTAAPRGHGAASVTFAERSGRSVAFVAGRGWAVRRLPSKAK